MDAAAFINGLELSRRFFHEAVAPAIERASPGLRYGAGRIGTGSEVLGFDTPMSCDHEWAPCVQVFLREDDADKASALREQLSRVLPREFLGYTVGMIESAAEAGTFHMGQTGEGALNHRVWFSTLRDFVLDYIAFDIRDPLEPADWLSIPSQKLRTIVAGAVHCDDLGELTALRRRFVYYPDDVWLYLLACGWRRIAQEEHLMPRAGFVGDELGSALIGSRLVRDAMSLCFLMERQYAPYPKWFGSGFSELQCSADLQPALWRAQTATDWSTREAALVEVYESLARMHNRLSITEPVREKAGQFFGRPFRVISAGQIADQIIARIPADRLTAIRRRPMIGGVDQWSDSSDMRSDQSLRARFRGFYT